jgi:vacuolar-type H+-ATPase subunit E/Vma4
MCPVTTGIALSTMVQAGMAVATAGMAVYQVKQGDEAAKAANKATEMQYDEETARAERDAKDRQNQLTAETVQEATKYQQQREQLALEGLREAAGARVASAESGVGGVTAARSFLSEEISEDTAEADLRTSEGFTQFNIHQRARGIATAKRDRKVNADFTRVANTRKRASGLDYASAGLSGFVQGGGATAIASAFADKKGKGGKSSSSSGSSSGSGGGK